MSFNQIHNITCRYVKGIGRNVGVYEREKTTPEEIVEAITLGTTERQPEAEQEAEQT